MEKGKEAMIATGRKSTLKIGEGGATGTFTTGTTTTSSITVDMGKQKHISISQIMMYVRCGEQHRRRYQEGDILQPGIAQVKGTSIHLGAKEIAALLKVSQRTVRRDMDLLKK